LPKINFSTEGEYYKKVLELTEVAFQKCGNKFIVGYTDLHPGLDCALAWRGINNLCMDLIMDPENAQKLFDLSTEHFLEVYNVYDDLLKANHTPSSTWINIPVPNGRMHIPSADFSFMISPEDFEKYGLPILKEEVNPDAHGLQTQLRVKALLGFEPKGLPEKEGTYSDCGATFLLPSARSEYLLLDFSVPNERLYWGYYNNQGNRIDQNSDMLKEQQVKGWPIFLREDNDWASGVAVKYGNSGILVVKESPKCVNQQTHNTGAFYLNQRGLAVTSWGLTPGELVLDRFRECWANWTILYQDGDDGLQLALKTFDAARYPVFPKRDLFILMNIWGLQIIWRASLPRRKMC
jgi:hypothetical protein